MGNEDNSIKITQRFEKKIYYSIDSCWYWLGKLQRKNYGNVNVGKRNIRAHRFSYELYVGKIPEGMLVCHTCDNPMCVNPDHLFIGTDKDNMHDMLLKERNKSKLKLRDVLSIRSMEHLPAKDVALTFGVTPRTINKIRSRQIWSVI